MQRKKMLEEFIYKLDDRNTFRCKAPMWSSPIKGFSYSNTLPAKYMKSLTEKDWFSEKKSDVICILGDWETVAEGIIFTDKALYLSSPKNSEKKFKVHYSDIIALNYNKNVPKLTIKTEKTSYVIDTEMWSKINIYDFLQFACELYEFSDKNKELILGIDLGKETVSSIIAGITYSNISNASSNYNVDKLGTPRGHGFAAEQANHLYDKIANTDFFGQNKVQLVGDDIDPNTGRIIKNGADRIVDGVQIQSKYCATGSKCVQECFENGNFRYWNADGTPMQVEVPVDKYDAAIQAMEERIRRGEVKGITDPKEAKNIIREGHFTYEQVKNIAKAGTVESIVFDAASGAIIAVNSFGITATISFATAVWNGADFDVAIKSAATQGLKVGGISFATSVLAGQLGKAGLNSLLVGSSEAVIQIIGPKASAILVNGFRTGTNIYGAAAMKSAAKMLRGNAITGIISVAVLSVGDVSNIFRGRISGKQLFKNVANTASSVAGDGAGWMAGAAAGSMILPGVGTVVGAFVGSMAGGTAASKVSGAVLNEFIEDDADEMLEIIQEVFAQLCEEFLITQDEAETLVEGLQNALTGNVLKDMYASYDKEEFVREMLTDDFEDVAKQRTFIQLPSAKEMQEGLKEVLEDIADSVESEETEAENEDWIAEETETMDDALNRFKNSLENVYGLKSDSKTPKKSTSKKKNKQFDFEQTKKQAENGDIDAQYQLGKCYEEGISTDEDDRLAVYWYTKAAMRFHGKAMCCLAKYYYNGIYVYEDEELAEALLLVSTDRETAVDKLEQWFDIDFAEDDTYTYHDSISEAMDTYDNFKKNAQEDVLDEIEAEIADEEAEDEDWD